MYRSALCEAERRIARWSNPPFLRRCAPSKGLRPLRGLRRLPAHPLNRYTRLRGYIGSAGLKTKTDTLTAHRKRPGGRSFLPIFQPKVDNTFYMARRRQEQTHTQRRDRDMDWRGTSHFLPWMVK